MTVGKDKYTYFAPNQTIFNGKYCLRCCQAHLRLFEKKCVTASGDAMRDYAVLKMEMRDEELGLCESPACDTVFSVSVFYRTGSNAMCIKIILELVIHWKLASICCQLVIGLDIVVKI